MGFVVVGKNGCGKKWMFITCFVRFSMFLFGLKYVSFASEDQDHQGIPLHFHVSRTRVEVKHGRSSRPKTFGGTF